MVFGYGGEYVLVDYGVWIGFEGVCVGILEVFVEDVLVECYW